MYGYTSYFSLIFQKTHIFYEKLKSSLKGSLILFFLHVMRTITYCSSIAIGWKVYKFLTEEFLVKNVCKWPKLIKIAFVIVVQLFFTELEISLNMIPFLLGRYNRPDPLKAYFRLPT